MAGGYILFGAAGLHRSARPALSRPDRPWTPRCGDCGSSASRSSRSLRLFPRRTIGDGFTADDFDAFLVANTAVGVLVVLRTGLLLHAVERARRAASLAQGRFESVFRSAGLGISITTGGVMAQTNSAFKLVGYSGEELSRMRPSMIIYPRT